MVLGAKSEETVSLVGVLAIKSAHESTPSGAEHDLGVFLRETAEAIEQQFPCTARIFNQTITMHHLENNLAASHVDEAASPG
jgi:primosomal replication protein N